MNAAPVSWRRRARPDGSGRRARRVVLGNGLGLEPLEPRTLLTVIPVFRTYSEADFGGDLPGSAGAAPMLETRPMQVTRLTGDLPTGDAGDYVGIALGAGQIVTLLAAPTASTGTPFALRVADATGRVLATSSGPAPVPETGILSAAPALTFRAATAGTYLVGLSGVDLAPGPVIRSYALDVRPIGLNRDAISTSDPAVLGAPASNSVQPGLQPAAIGTGITGFLNAGRLNLVGPTGYGFEMTGNWTQIATVVSPGQTRLTFVASAGLGIVTPIGTLPMPLPKGTSIILTTMPNGAGGAFGEIDKTRIITGLAWLDQLTQRTTTSFGSTYVLPDGSGSLDTQKGVSVGLALGSTIMTTIDVNAPLNANVPYFYVVFSSGTSASFGNFSISTGPFAGQTKITAFADPADPFLYFGLGTPGNVPVLAGLGIGVSFNARIPFTPNPKPSQYDGTLYGHVYAQLELNIPAYKVINVNVNGKTVINIDATGDGQLIDYLRNNPSVALGGAWAAGQLGAAFAANPALFQDLAVGASASIGVNVSPPKIANATFTLGRASVIYTGTASPNMYFRGIATNNLLTGTMLEPYAQYIGPTQTFIVDGAASPGLFNASFTTEYAFFGASATLTTSIFGSGLLGAAPQLIGTIDGKATLLGVANVSVKGILDQDGTFLITGNANVQIAGFTLASGRFRISNQGIAVNGFVDLGPLGSAAVASAVTAKGDYILVGSFQTDWGIDFAPKVTADLVLSNAGLKATTTVSFLGQDAQMTGTIQPNLDVSLSGKVRTGFSVLGASVGATVQVTLARAGGVTSLGGTYDFGFGGYGLSFDVSMAIFLAYAGLGIPVYSGSGSASVTGPLGTSTISVAVMNNAMVIDVPLVPLIVIPLPF